MYASNRNNQQHAMRTSRKAALTQSHAAVLIDDREIELSRAESALIMAALCTLAISLLSFSAL